MVPGAGGRRPAGRARRPCLPGLLTRTAATIAARPLPLARLAET